MKRFALFFVVAAMPGLLSAQTTSSNHSAKSAAAYEEFQKKAQDRYKDFTSKANERYADFMRKAWEKYSAMAGVPSPEDNVKPVQPVELPVEPVTHPKPIEDRRLQVKEEPVKPLPKPEPQPQPVEPVKEQPLPAPVYREFIWHGTAMRVRETTPFRIGSSDERGVADAWKKLSDGRCNNLLRDCLALREEKALCDWAYLTMLSEVGKNICGGNSNEASLLTAWLYCQSGYKMRLAFDGNRLVMLFASEHVIYNHPYFTLDGTRYYPFGRESESMRICSATYPNERPMSLLIVKLPAFTAAPSPQREIASKRYPEIRATVSVNRNAMEFFGSYPSSEVNSNFMTRWAMYAKTPLCKEVSQSIYPVLKQQLKGMTVAEATERLLNWVQTGFVYGLDDEVWGGDRPFFGDETLFYPYSDCEDRSILFSHLVRELLGLDVALVYYPGHLATAVAFPGNVAGDYIMIGSRRFTVCDPTYINASIGMTMPGMENSAAKVIVL